MSRRPTSSIGWRTYIANDTDLTEMTRALVDSGSLAHAQSKLKLPEDYAISCYRSLGLTISDRPVPPQSMYNFETYVEEALLGVARQRLGF